MFNLIVTANREAWMGRAYELERSRMFEHTADGVAERFKSLGEAEIKALCDLPTLFAYEGTEDEPVRIGKVSRLSVRGMSVRLEYELFDIRAPLTNRMLIDASWDLDIGKSEPYRTHWAVKDVDLFMALIEADLMPSYEVLELQRHFGAKAASEPYSVSPRIFRIPSTGIEEDLVSVMFPFQPAFTAVYAATQKACGQQGLRCVSANEVWDNSEIIQDIFSLIFRSKVVVCDFSDKNANVFYEAGIAHTLGRTVVPIVQNSEHIPFDLRHHRYIQYLNNEQGLGELTEKLSRRLESLKTL